MNLLCKMAFLGMTLAPLSYAQSTELSRLFFTPEQRSHLNDRSLTDNDNEASSTSLTVNGIVQQQGGKRTAWINGVARNLGNSDEHDPASVPLTIPNQTRPITVKVGQQININNDGKH